MPPRLVAGFARGPGPLAWRAHAGYTGHIRVEQDRAYWLYIQRYFAGGRVFRMARGAAGINVRISTDNLLNEATVRQFAGFRDAFLTQAWGAISHGKEDELR